MKNWSRVIVVFFIFLLSLSTLQTLASRVLNSHPRVKADQNQIETFGFDGTQYVAGSKYPQTQVGLESAIATAGNNGKIVIPAGTMIPIDTSTPLSITQSGLTIEGTGNGAGISFTGRGNVINLSGSRDTFRNLLFVSQASTERSGAAVFNFQKGGGLTLIENVGFIGAARINNGIIFNEQTVGEGVQSYDHIRVYGSNDAIWTNVLISQGSRGVTIANTTINDLVVFVGVSCSDACMVADSLTDTWTVSNSILVPSSGVPVETRNTQAGPDAPRWIHFVNSFIECGGSTVPGPGLKINAGRDIKYLDGYVASCAVGAVLNGGSDIDISHNIFVAIGQSAVAIGPIPAHTIISYNNFDDTGISLSSTYDTISVAGGGSRFDISHNTWQQTGLNVPRYGINLLAGPTDAFDIISNDLSGVKFEKGSFHNEATGENQYIWANRGVGLDVMRTSSGLPTVFGNGLQFWGNLSATSLLSSTIAPTISSGFGMSPRIVQQNGTAAFEVDVGAGGTATSGTIRLPAAVNGWACQITDMTANVVTRETAFTPTTVTLTAAAAWSANDKLLLNCTGF